MAAEFRLDAAVGAVQPRRQVARGPTTESVEGDLRGPASREFEQDQVKIVRSLWIAASGHSRGNAQRILAKEKTAQIKDVRAKFLTGVPAPLAAPARLGLVPREKGLLNVY